MIRLVVTAKGESRVVETAERVVTIGRGHESTVPIHDEGASRKHCAIERLADGSVRLSDLASRNGTLVNGERVNEKALKAGDVIHIGATNIAVEALSADAAPAPVPAPTAPAVEPKPAAPAAAAAPGLRLVFAAGPSKGKTFLVRERITRIGRRRRDNDIALFDTGISNRHAEIRQAPEGYVLVDVGSRNGTILNGERVQHSPVKPGDSIQIGRSIIHVQAPDATTAPTSAMPKPSPADLAPAAPAAAPAAVPPPLQPPAGAPAAEAAEPQVAAAARSRRRVLLLVGAIALGACFFGGVHIVRALRRGTPAPAPAPKQPDAGTAPAKATTQSLPRATTATRATTAAAPQKTDPAVDAAAREKRQKADLDAALDALRRAGLTGEAADFDAAQRMLEVLRPGLKGTGLERAAAKALDGLPAARQAAADRRRDASAEALLAAARRYNGSREPNLARLHCRELLARFPDSPAAAEAKALLDALGAPAEPPKEK
ncbi:MAG TPA: FHA domain-containing protein [Planctomycetota bacterium]|nr:FHA domain-containing protein [Planctomycetota bacterium]